MLQICFKCLVAENTKSIPFLQTPTKRFPNEQKEKIKMEGNENQEITWNVALEKLLAEEGEKALGLAWLHNQCEQYYGARSNWISIPVIVLSTLSGTASASSTTFFADNMKMGSLGIGAISILCGVLNTVNSYFAYAKRTEAHRIADIQFNKVYRFIATEMTLPRLERIRARDMLKIVREQVERLAETSPPIPEFIVEKFKKNFRKDYKDIAQPDITNGLRRIRINQTGVVSPPILKTPRAFSSSDSDSNSNTNTQNRNGGEGDSEEDEQSPDSSRLRLSSSLSSKINEIAAKTEPVKVTNPIVVSNGLNDLKIRASDQVVVNVVKKKKDNGLESI